MFKWDLQRVIYHWELLNICFVWYNIIIEIYKHIFGNLLCIFLHKSEPCPRNVYGILNILKISINKTMHREFSSTSEGPYVALAAASPWWPDGDQLTGPQFLYWSILANPRDGAAEKEFFGLPFNASGYKTIFFCHI